jgi:hypothetical protein
VSGRISAPAWDLAWECLQLLGLPRPQDLAHGDRGNRYMKFEVALIVSLSQGDAPAQSTNVRPPLFIVKSRNYGAKGCAMIWQGLVDFWLFDLSVFNQAKKMLCREF